MASASYRGFGAILKTEDQDDGTIKVFGVASTASRDHADEIVTSEAMKAALPDYSKHPALREQHDSTKAAGRTLDAYVDDDGATQIEAHVVDPVAIAKVKAGVYSGFSIGGTITKRDTADRSIITGIRLVEISLVDSPCNPDATLNMWKADTMSDNNPSGDEVVAKAKEMATAAGRKAFKDFLYKARETLLAERGLPVQADRDAADAAAKAAREDDAAKAAFAEALDAAVSTPEIEVVAAAPVATEVAADTAKAAAADPAAALSEALAKAKAATEEAAAPTADLAADLRKGAAVLRVLVAKAETDLAKGLYTVSRFAEVIDAVVSIQAGCTYEAEYEGDNSPVPAQIAASVAALCVNLRDMVNEETAEILATYAAAGIDIDFDAAEDAADDVIIDLQLAAAAVDLVKADTALMAKAGSRNSKSDAASIQDIHDKAAGLGATCMAANVPENASNDQGTEEDSAKAALIAENDRLAKALADAAPAVEEITKAFGDKLGALTATIGDLTKRLETVESTPAAPKTATGVLRTIAKGEDVSPSTVEAHEASAADVLSVDEFRKHFDSLPEAEKGNILLRVALNNPQIIKPARTAA